MTICWEIGQASRIHNHRDQNCWMSAPIGRLKVQNFRVDDRDSARGTCRIVPTDIYEMDAAHPAHVNPLEPVHQVLNLAEFHQLLGEFARPRSARQQRVIQEAIDGGEIIAVGVLHLVRKTIVSALSGVQNVGAELGAATVTAVRGSIKAAYSIGGDLGTVAREAIRGTVTAAEEIGGDLSGVARSAARGAVKATGDVGGDVAVAARRAVEGTVVAAKELGVDVRGLAQSAADEGEILNLGVAPAHRCRGVGRALVEGVLALLAARGVRQVFLEVRESNAVARRLYQEQAAWLRSASLLLP